MTIKEFAKRTGLKPEEIKNLIHNHRIKAKKVEGKFKISDNPVQWLKENPKFNQGVGETLDDAEKGKGARKKDAGNTKKSAVHAGMKAISDSAKQSIAKVFEDSFEAIIKKLNEHADAMPTNMRKELLQAIKRGCEKHNLDKVHNSINEFNNTICNEYVPILKDIKRDTNAACQASEKWVTREYLGSQIEGISQELSEIAKSMVTRKEHDRVKELAEKNQSATAELVTQRDLKNLQTNLDNQLAGMSMRLETKESLDNKLYQYAKYGLIGIGLIAVLSIINLLFTFLP